MNASLGHLDSSVTYFHFDEQNITGKMTKVSPEFVGGEVQMYTFKSVSADVSFASNQFPKYKLGPDFQILEEASLENKGPSLKEVVEEETTRLTEQHKRLSVRDLASKFDKNLSSAAKLANEVPNYLPLSVHNTNCIYPQLAS